jgi:hypothetical protein
VLDVENIKMRLLSEKCTFSDLEAKEIFKHDSQEVAGVKGSTADDPPAKPHGASWLTIWKRETENNETPICSAKGCMKKADKGAHVWLWDDETGKFDKTWCYIVPTCGLHNGPNFEYPRGYFHTRRNTWFLKIRPHECYSDYGFDY